MAYLGTSINESPVIAELAGATIADVRGKAVKYSSGNVVLCSTAGEAVLGVGIMTNGENLQAGDQVDIQIKDIGALRAGGTIAKGDELAVDATGCFVKATDGQDVFAIALDAGAKDEYVRSMIVRYKKPAATGGVGG